MPSVVLRKAQQSDLPMLDRLFQLYLHDFDTYLKIGVGDDGRYALDFSMEDELDKPGFWNMLAYADGKLAGFAMWNDQTVFKKSGRYVLEFFVVRGLRAQGVGRQMAYQMFDTYRGYWEVVQIAPNKPATAFWKHILDDYLDTGQYEETETFEGEDKHFIWQMFDSSATSRV